MLISSNYVPIYNFYQNVHNLGNQVSNFIGFGLNHLPEEFRQRPGG